jgi:hypothetical protein
MNVSSTHNRMGAVKPHVLRWIAVAFATAAVAVPVAQAGGPDDRPDYRGTSPALTPSSTSPDDRGDDRGSSDTLAPTRLGPDDRAFARSVHGIEPASVPVEVQPRGFEWGDAVVGGTLGFGLALFGVGAIVIAQRRRSTLALRRAQGQVAAPA